ncbi:hypothetical protein GCM10027341_08440 [Spirosoma knui]
MNRLSIYRTVLLFFALILVGTSCKKEAEPTPQARFTVYTQIASKFDRLDVYIDKKLVGAITATSPTIPDCGTAASASVFTVPVQTGARDIVVRQIYNNKEVGIWDDWTITFTEGQCVRKKLTE